MRFTSSHSFQRFRNSSFPSRSTRLPPAVPALRSVINSLLDNLVSGSARGDDKSMCARASGGKDSVYVCPSRQLGVTFSSFWKACVKLLSQNVFQSVPLFWKNMPWAAKQVKLWRVLPQQGVSNPPPKWAESIECFLMSAHTALCTSKCSQVSWLFFEDRIFCSVWSNLIRLMVPNVKSTELKSFQSRDGHRSVLEICLLPFGYFLIRDCFDTNGKREACFWLIFHLDHQTLYAYMQMMHFSV